ncbi:MAG: mechanosensitive ion channel family protein [Candidatus Nanohalobium sp.]
MAISSSFFEIGWQKISVLGFSLNPFTVIAALVVTAAAVISNRLINKAIEKTVKKRSGDQHAALTAKKASNYGVYSIAGVVILGVFGVPLSALGTVVGLLGLGLSFALKDTISNFIAGLMILVNRPFTVGDQIKAQGEEGTVKDIRVRATDIKTYDGRKVIIPNSRLYNDVVTNNTAYDERRFEVIVGVGYDDDIEKAKELAKESLEESEAVEMEPSPEVLVDELGGSSVNLKLRAWSRPSKANMVSAASEVTQKVKERFDREGIDIPYPIRTVYMENGDQE